MAQRSILRILIKVQINFGLACSVHSKLGNRDQLQKLERPANLGNLHLVKLSNHDLHYIEQKYVGTWKVSVLSVQDPSSRIFAMPSKVGVLGVPEASKQNSIGSWKVDVLGVPDDS